LSLNWLPHKIPQTKHSGGSLAADEDNSPDAQGAAPPHKHYNNRGLFCDPNIIANNKERCF